MKKIIALCLVLVMATLCACGNSTEATKKKRKKKIVYVQQNEASSVDDTSSKEESEEDSDYYFDDDTDYDTSYEEADKSTAPVTREETVTVNSAIKKVTASDIGKNYYNFKPETAHPGVVDMDAKYEMVALDKRNRTLDSDKMVISCSDKSVKIENNIVTVPYSVRKAGKKVTVNMYNKDYKNRTGSYTFDFSVQFTAEPTFFDDFNTLDPKVWKDNWYEGTMPLEELHCENGELVMYANKSSKGIELSTTGTFNQAYGCFSARIKMPKSGLTNIAFWLCTEPGVTYIKNPQRPTQSGGEIDIVEYFPTWGDNKTSCTMHWNGWSNYHTNSGAEPTVKQNLRGEYHIYSAVWTSSAVYFYLDDDLIWTYTGEGVGKNSGPMQILLQHSNPRADSDWGGVYDPSELPNESRWDYVKVYGLKSE